MNNICLICHNNTTNTFNSEICKCKFDLCKKCITSHKHIITYKCLFNCTKILLASENVNDNSLIEHIILKVTNNLIIISEKYFLVNFVCQTILFLIVVLLIICYKSYSGFNKKN